MTIETILSDVSIDETNLTEADAAEAFLRNWAKPDAKKPSEAAEDEAEADETVETAVEEQDDKDEEQAEESDETEESDEDQDGSEAEDGEENEEAAEAKVADDAAIVKVTVDGKETTVSVASLKRLAGQEASLTQKSQAVSAKLKEASDLASVHDTALKGLYERAAAKLAPYAKIDYLVAQTSMSKEDFAQLRADAQAAHTEFAFLEGELKSAVEKRNTAATTATKEAVDACITAINDPKHPAHIPNWSTQVYDGIRSYAVSLGVPQEAVDNLTDPISISILNKARKYDAGKKVLTKKKATAGPVKTLKSTKSDKSHTRPKTEAAMSKLQKSGSTADAAEAFLASWQT